MDSVQPAQSILDTLRTVEFRLGLKGYNVDEVDEYLEKAAVEAESVKERLRQGDERLRQAQERIGQLEEELGRVGSGEVAPPVPTDQAVPDDSLQRTLMMAQRFVDQAKRESEAEAAAIVANAEERASGLLNEAEERARQMSNEAEGRLREDVGRLEALRSQLSADVEEMARHLEAERTRLRLSLTEIMKWVDERVQPASALVGGRRRSDDGAEPGRALTGAQRASASAGGGSASGGQGRGTGPGTPASGHPQPAGQGTGRSTDLLQGGAAE